MLFSDHPIYLRRGSLRPFIATQTEIRLIKVDLYAAAMDGPPSGTFGRAATPRLNTLKAEFTNLAKKWARGNAREGETAHDQAMRATTYLIELIRESGAPDAEKQWVFAELLRLHLRDRSRQK
jgi:hypothetical protein